MKNTKFIKLINIIDKYFFFLHLNIYFFIIKIDIYFIMTLKKFYFLKCFFVSKFNVSLIDILAQD